MIILDIHSHHREEAVAVAGGPSGDVQAWAFKYNIDNQPHGCGVPPIGCYYGSFNNPEGVCNLFFVSQFPCLMGSLIVQEEVREDEVNLEFAPRRGTKDLTVSGAQIQLKVDKFFMCKPMISFMQG